MLGITLLLVFQIVENSDVSRTQLRGSHHKSKPSLATDDADWGPACAAWHGADWHGGDGSSTWHGDDVTRYGHAAAWYGLIIAWHGDDAAYDDVIAQC